MQKMEYEQACEMKFQKIEIKRENRDNNVHESLLESISIEIMKTLQCDVMHLVLFIDTLPNGDRLMLANFYEKENVYCTATTNIPSFSLVIRSGIQRIRETERWVSINPWTTNVIYIWSTYS